MLTGDKAHFALQEVTYAMQEVNYAMQVIACYVDIV